jgi:hypothetical protein
MKNIGPWVLAPVMLVLVLIGAVFFFIGLDSTPVPPDQESAPAPILEEENAKDTVEEAAQPETFAEPVVADEPVVPVATLPDLNDSDTTFLSAILRASTNERIASLLVNDEMIRKSVRAISNLSEGQVVKAYRPIATPDGTFLAEVIDIQNERKRFAMREENLSRYARHLQVLSWLSPESAASVYREYYPLLQQAYDELGLREPSFYRVTHNALDQILASPVIADDAVLESPSVMYVFEDKSFESQSGVKKLLWRLGPEQAQRVRTWAGKFKSELNVSKQR